MRKMLHRFLSLYRDPNTYLLHADMWGFPTKGNVINCGVGEINMVNIAAGLASQGKRVIIYGVAGFVLYKGYEQIKLNIKGWAENKGTIIFTNAGYNGCYGTFGRGHLVYDDWKLCEALEIPVYTPTTGKEFIRIVKNKCKEKGVSFIRLGWDTDPWC